MRPFVLASVVMLAAIAHEVYADSLLGSMFPIARRSGSMDAGDAYDVPWSSA